MSKFVVPVIVVSMLSFTQLSAQDVRAPMRPPEGASVAMNPIDVNVDDYLSRITLPPGFEISIYARDIEGARSMALGDDGTVYVGTRFNRNRENIGKVYAVIDKDGDYQVDEVVTVAEGLNVPNGVAWHDGDLYVGEINRVIRYEDIATNLRNSPEYAVIDDTLPDDIHHGWKFIRFGPDNRLYVPVGAPCNICEPEPTHSNISRMNSDGSGKEVYARGIRNTVGFDWHPQTRELWFTDNGRDLWGDDRPPDEINHAPVPGLHFGFPYRYGKDLIDDTYPTRMTDSEFQPAAYEMPAHTAGLGVRFYTGSSFPARYRNQMLVTYHGSWNSSTPVGYNVAMIRFENDRPAGHEYLATGWLVDDHYWGRPVDIEILADGSILVSDDHANVIYRITYKG